MVPSQEANNDNWGIFSLLYTLIVYEAILMSAYNIQFHHIISLNICFLKLSQLAFFINLQRAVIGPSATLTGR